jgi:hypothetical protein
MPTGIDLTISREAGAWPDRKALGVAAFVTLFAFLVYLRTLAPTITWHNDGADGGDLIAAVATGGVPHPTGYPTYLLLGSLFAHLPPGDLAYRLNLMSAVAAAGAVGLFFLAVIISLQGSASHIFLTAECAENAEKKIKNEGWVALLAAGVAALTLAFSSILWSQAVIAEVYTLGAFFAALSCFLALYARATGRVWPWIVAAWAFGLGLGNHLSLVLLAPAGLVLLLERNPFSWRKRVSAGHWAVMAVAFLAGLAVYAVLPFRAAHHPPVNWGGAETWAGFLWLLSGRLYAPLAFGVPLPYLPGRALAAASLLSRQVAWWGLPMVFMGLRALWTHDRPLALASAFGFVAVTIYAVGYNTTDSYVYLIPAALILTFWMAWGLYDISTLPQTANMRKDVRLAAGCGLVLLAFLPLLYNLQAVDASGDLEAYNYGVAALAAVEQEAVIVADSDRDTFALWYFRYAEGHRPDIAVVNGPLLPYHWYRESVLNWHPTVELPSERADAREMVQELIKANLSKRSIYLTSSAWTLPPGYDLVTDGVLYRVELKVAYPCCQVSRTGLEPVTR